MCNYLILPLFAFSNTGINLGIDVDLANMDTLMSGIICGLVIGKPLGIMLFSFVATKLNLSERPKGAD